MIIRFNKSPKERCSGSYHLFSFFLWQIIDFFYHLLSFSQGTEQWIFLHWLCFFVINIIDNASVVSTVLGSTT